MSSRGWKLSAALISLFCISATAGPERVALTKCIHIAALSFADQSAETAASIAKAAVQSCEGRIRPAAEEGIISVRKPGSSVSVGEVVEMLERHYQQTTESFVIEMRALARNRGPGFYAEAAQRIASGM